MSGPFFLDLVSKTFLVSSSFSHPPVFGGPSGVISMPGKTGVRPASGRILDLGDEQLVCCGLGLEGLREGVTWERPQRRRKPAPMGVLLSWVKSGRRGTCKKMLGGHKLPVFSPRGTHTSFHFLTVRLRTVWASKCGKCLPRSWGGSPEVVEIICGERPEVSRQKYERTLEKG